MIDQELATQFVALACLCHDDPHYDHRSFQVRAREMLLEHSWLGEANIWSAAAAGNPRAVSAILDEHPDLINQPGPFGWVPLICACYSRAGSTFEAAKTLLDRGADPNAYTMKGNADERLDQTARRFTALTGVFGGGSTGLANQPPHPEWRELAELLLLRGADPADEMALAINQTASVEILLRHGLTPDRMGRDGVSIMGRELCIAARYGRREVVESLIQNHARSNERFDGKTAWRHAMERGHREIARILEQAGAETAELSDVEQFVSLCLAGDEKGAREMVEHLPDLLALAPKSLVHKAVDTGKTKAVRLALDLGFDVNDIDDNAPIHMAGTLAENEEMLRLLLERGASLRLRDPWYDGTGIGWAHFFDYIELRDKLLNEPDICLFDALEFGRFDRLPDILARDPEALERPFARYLSREPKAADWQTPLARMVSQGNEDAVRTLLHQGADRAARHPDGRTLVEVARDAGFPGIAELLEPKASL